MFSTELAGNPLTHIQLPSIGSYPSLVALSCSATCAAFFPSSCPRPGPDILPLPMPCIRIPDPNLSPRHITRSPPPTPYLYLLQWHTHAPVLPPIHAYTLSPAPLTHALPHVLARVHLNAPAPAPVHPPTLTRVRACQRGGAGILSRGSLHRRSRQSIIFGIYIYF